ncbi:MAG: PAS domain S-box protein [Verrucomicrobiia bacterium]
MQPDRIRILLVADSPAFARSVEDFLGEASGFDLEVSVWPRADLDDQEKARPDVVVIELAPSPEVGLGRLRHIRQHHPNAAIVACSDTDHPPLPEQVRAEGAKDFLLQSQINSPLLIRSIRYALECKRSELATAKAETKYRRISEHLVEGVFQSTPGGCYINVNPTLARIYGYDSPEELIGNLTDIAAQLYVEPNRREEFVRLMEERDVVTNFESQVRRKDGSVIWISENVRAIRDDKGRLLHYEGTVEDITERKSREEELRNSETLYHSLVETLPQNIFRKDLNERFTFANQRFCQSLGRPLEEILGKTDFDFFPPELAEKYQQDDRRIMETGESFETVEEHVPPGGEKLYVNVVKTPLYDSKGNIIGLQGIFWDITERRRAEEDLRRTTVELAKSREELRGKNRQLEEDLRMAREIQQAIIPQQYPVFGSGAAPTHSLLRFSHRYLPTGAVGGDFFNVRAISDTLAGVFICDVMGHGVRSALVTAIMRALVEELAGLATEPGRLLGQLNQDLRAILRQSGTPMLTTAFYLVADLERGTMTYANAGHPKPLRIRRSTGQVDVLANASGRGYPALGLFEDAAYPTTQHPLNTGDFIMLFTDGLYDIEGPHQDQISPDWLLAEVRQRTDCSVAELFDGLLSQLQSLSDGAGFADDVCLVGMEVTLPAAAPAGDR